ncbi:Imm12 family immunity protein [Paenibacillus ehimensis]|uniref:Imm12 family immunity protein n=1 Tax=Paenibacillus ehimensis TaxID=79264 RepID=UPI000FDB8A7B|nr:Imm12 family immunity protein [Paenibacillus ehimensis]
MKLNIGVRLGGTPEISNAIMPLVVNLRKKLDSAFLSANFGDDVASVDYLLCINGEIVKYFETSGVYGTKFMSKKKVIYVDICIDESIWTSNEKENELIFLDKFKKLLLESGKEIKDKLQKKKLDFNYNLFEEKILSCF